MRAFCYLLLPFVICTIGSCKTIAPRSYISPNKKLESVINQSLDYFGGIEKHASIARLVYNKKVILYKEDGQIEKEILEAHNYNYREGIFSINRNIAGVETEFYMKNKKNYATENGERSELPNIETTFNTAFYVIGMPFKFLDTGVELQLLEEKGNLISIQADYNSADNTNHAGNERWIYYLDNTTGNILQQIAYASDHISLIKNEAYHNVEGYKFIKKRTSFRVDEDFSILYKRADYDYYDLEIVFK